MNICVRIHTYIHVYIHFVIAQNSAVCSSFRAEHFRPLPTQFLCVALLHSIMSFTSSPRKFCTCACVKTAVVWRGMCVLRRPYSSLQLRTHSCVKRVYIHTHTSTRVSACMRVCMCMCECVLKWYVCVPWVCEIDQIFQNTCVSANVR